MPSSEDSFRSKSILGISWNVFGNITANGISFVVGVILARILSPEDFGLVGMIAVLIAISNAIVDSGISTGLIRKVKVEPEEYSTAFIINFGFAITLYLFLFIGAPAIANFFNEKKLVDLVRILAGVILINSLGFVHQAILTRDLVFKPLALASIIASVVSGIFAIFLAIRGFSYWSIVWQVILRQFVFTIFLWFSTKWIPILWFSKTAFKQLMNFGSKVLFSGLISSLQQNIYYFIIGKIFSVSTLGHYNRAESFNSLATSNITGTFSKVFFPILSSLQHDQIRLRANLVRVNCITFFLSAIIMISMAAMAKPLILLLLGSKWIESAWMLQLMCMTTLTMSLNALNRDMLFIKGRSDVFLNFQGIKFFLFIPGVFLAYYFGVKVLLVYAVFTSLISFFINSSYAKVYFDYSSWQQLKDVAPYFVVTVFSGIATWSITLLNYAPLIILIVQLLVAVLVLIGVGELLGLLFYKELRSIVVTGFYRITKMRHV